MTMTASHRATMEAMTDAQLRDVIRFARRDETNDLAHRNRLHREAQEAEAILAQRQPAPVKWIITARGAACRATEWQMAQHRGRIGVQRYDGNRPLRPYYLAGPDVPDEWAAATFFHLAQAKRVAEEIIAEIDQQSE